MTEPTFRHPDLYQRLAHRDYIRQHMPPGTDGFVAEDLDLVLVVFGRQGVDSRGRLRLVEIKHGDAPMDVAQRKTFKLLDRLCRHGDDCGRYAGFFLVHASHPWDDERVRFRINGVDLTPQAFDAWLRWEADVAPYNFGGWP